MGFLLYQHPVSRFKRLTKQSRVFLQMFIIAHLAKSFIEFYGNRKFISWSKSARHYTRSELDKRNLYPHILL